MADPLVLFHLSDIHFGLEDRTALAWMEQCIAAEAPAAVAITGDLTMRARSRVNSTLRCNVSPGITGRRKRTPSIPAK